MPAPVKMKAPAGQSWGITFKEVMDAKREYENEHNCKIVLTVDTVELRRGGGHFVWAVAGEARGRNYRSGDPIGCSSCLVGGNRGAATLSGAMLNAIIQAADLLEERRQAKLRAYDPAPTFWD
jgi:hypothetical protein